MNELLTANEELGLLLDSNLEMNIREFLNQMMIYNSGIKEIRTKVDAMVEARKKANNLEDEYAKASAYHAIAESLEAIRKPIDKLEEIVDNDSWPLPKYRELLFIN